MKIIIAVLFILFTANTTVAQYSFYAIKKSDIRMSNESFRRYARPQIKSIINEFFHILKKVSPESEPVINTRRNLQQLYLESVELTKFCDLRDITLNDKCATQIKDFSRKLKLFEARLYKYISNYKLKSNRIDDSIAFNVLLQELVLSNAKINHHFDEFKMLRGTGFQRYSKSPIHIERVLHESLKVVDLKLNILVLHDYRVEFDNVWSSFIRILEQRILLPNDKDYLLDNLERLNIDWNSFHKNMTKGNYDIPLSKVKVTNIMHNRWNSILKLILRR